MGCSQSAHNFEIIQHSYQVHLVIYAILLADECSPVCNIECEAILEELCASILTKLAVV